MLGIGAPGAQPQSSGKSFDHLPASDRQLISVKVSGTKRYADDAVIAASGLQMGTAIVAILLLVGVWTPISGALTAPIELRILRKRCIGPY